jgi:RES domain
MPESYTPAPGKTLRVKTKVWPKDQPLHRIHRNSYAANGFNPGLGNARFSPINDSNGKSIPTIYAGDDFECAAMESVFHDVSFVPGFKAHPKSAFENQVYSVLQCTRDLTLVDLSLDLRKLGVTAGQLINTEKDQYPRTRLWAEAIHQQFPEVDGLQWTSRQHQAAQAVLLFGDRVKSSELLLVGKSVGVAANEPKYPMIVALAEDLDVYIVDDHE